MGIANFPFPSFTLLLTSDRVIIPGPSYVLRIAPLKQNHDLIEDCYPLLDFENDSTTDVVLGHCDAEEFVDDVTETISLSTRSVERTIVVEKGVGIIKTRFSFLKSRPSVRFSLKKILKRFSQFKLD